MQSLVGVIPGQTEAVFFSPFDPQEAAHLPLEEARKKAKAQSPNLLFCHGLSVAARLGVSGPLAGYDLLELFAFVRPASFCLPTPAGVAEAVAPSGKKAIAAGSSSDLMAASLFHSAQALIDDFKAEVASANDSKRHQLFALIEAMQAASWPWAKILRKVGGFADGSDSDDQESDNSAQNTPSFFRSGLEVWQGLPEWAERAPPLSPSDQPVTGGEARSALDMVLNQAGFSSRPGQADYAEAVTEAFQPRKSEDGANLVLAEAGTGTGKTLGYIAPALSWAVKNKGPVWISTFTRNLQQQIEDELNRIYPDPQLRAERVVVRKGRENYLCLLNYEELVAGIGFLPEGTAGLGLIARFLSATTSGDLTGGDFPGWLGELLGAKRLYQLHDKRGECIYSACPHYRRCFIERTKRASIRADLVIANHALVMRQTQPEFFDSARFVFDEGHHLFEAADSAFSIRFCGQETEWLRRYIRGNEQSRSGRAKGLAERLEEGMAIAEVWQESPDNKEGSGKKPLSLREDLAGLARAASQLPDQDWRRRIFDLPEDKSPKDKNTAENQSGENPLQNAFLPSGQPALQLSSACIGPVEELLHQIFRLVMKRAAPREREGGFDLELTIAPEPALLPALDQSIQVLVDMERYAARLLAQFNQVLVEAMDILETDQRFRLEQTCRILEQRVVGPVQAWAGLLHAIKEDSESISGPDSDFIDWYMLNRQGGRAQDVGISRHWLDPSRPFARVFYDAAHGALITSATLTSAADIKESVPADTRTPDSRNWAMAEALTGTRHQSDPALRVQVVSPFAYGKMTRVLLVNDLDPQDIDVLARAMLKLTIAAGGGALGLFTAIGRLRAVHGRIAGALESEGLPLYAQHIDKMSTTSLIDIFRAETDACLFGTDAVRDGIDVPGRSLRLLMFDKTPWPRPTILHRARRDHFKDVFGSSNGFDDEMTKGKLRQAFGRLIRTEQDSGVFVMLDRRFPSRLMSAFPEGVSPMRVGIAEAIRLTADFLETSENTRAIDDMF